VAPVTIGDVDRNRRETIRGRHEGVGDLTAVSPIHRHLFVLKLKSDTSMSGDDLIEVLGNKYNTDILTATEEAKSAQDLSDELDVPIATCYRRIDELEDAELIELHDRPLSAEHRRVKVYRRTVDGVAVDFRDELTVELEERSAVQNRLDEVWRDLSATQ
jgi:DNA-binding MarR family transcriptional regulator